MKKVLFVFVAAFALAACENDELEMINKEMKVAEEQSEGKKDANFRIFNDRINKGKE